MILTVVPNAAENGEAMGAFGYSITLLALVLLIAGIVTLQIFLSKRESKWAGLILPIISFGISLIAGLGILLFSVATGTTTSIVDGEIIEQTRQIASTPSIIFSAIYVFLLYNIPTGILLAIYAACRGKRKKQRDLEKMSVQDL
jgi:membrane protease YdiL (CAAX protease family)